jgi:ADP-heptose:LPS heptosyltransferase
VSAQKAGPFDPGLLSRLPASPRRIAIVKPSRIGDFLCATPALRALRHALPEARITLITLPILRDLALRCPHVDHFAPFPGFPGLAEQLFEPERAVTFLRRIQAEQFDLSIQLQGSGVFANPFTLLLGAKYTAGFVRPGDPAGMLAAALPLPEEGHEIDRMLALPAFLGAAPEGTTVDFPFWPEDHAGAQALLGEAEAPLIGLHPAARDRTRRWPFERFIQAAEALQKQHGGTVVYLGEASENEAAERVARSLSGPCLNLAGRTPLGVLGAVIARLDILLTNDTGPAHIAYALKTPVVTIFGAGDPARYGPPSGIPARALVHPVDCRPCGFAECPIGYPCLEHITVEQVTAAAGELLAAEG